MERSLFSTIKKSVPLGFLGVMLLFVTEFVLSNAFFAIHPRTYLFLFLLYVIAGVMGGAVLGSLIHLVSGKLNDWGVDVSKQVFFPTCFLFIFYFGYGFYYINEKLTAGVGLFAPLSLIADALFLIFCLGLFYFAMAFALQRSPVVLNFLEIATLPLILLVAINFRFFIWQPPYTDTGQLFWGVTVFGLVGFVGLAISYALFAKILGQRSKPLRIFVLTILSSLALAGFILTGFPSTTSFYLPHSASKASLAPQRNPNVIWIVMDTARRDDISLYGSEQGITPNIDKFSNDALVFNQAIATAPWTVPSHASMFTGMYPSKHGAHHTGKAISDPLSEENVTIAEILRNAGYKTAGIAANNAGLSRTFGFSQGFDYYFDSRPFVYNLFWGKLLEKLSENFRTETLWINEVTLASAINPVVYDWLDQRTGGTKKPFFLFVNYMEPHGGIAFIPAPYDSMFGFNRKKYEEIFKGFEAEKVVHFEGEVSEEQKKFYDAYVRRKIFFMDHYIGQLLQKLKDEGLYEDSYIILTSDHGELFGEHHSFGHNTDLYNELIWIPMMIKYPGASRTGAMDKLVQTVDLMPELLSYLGIEIPENVQGQPIDEVSHPIVAELFEQKNNFHVKLFPERYLRDLRAIYSNVAGDSLKYIWASNGKDQLFDLETDPSEQTNLVESRPKPAAILNNRLTKWRDGFVPVKSEQQQMTSKELEKNLRSLGYIK